MNKMNSHKCINVDLMTKSWVTILMGNSCDGMPTLAFYTLSWETTLNGPRGLIIKPLLYFSNQGTLVLFQNIAPYSEYLHYNDNSYHLLSTYEVTAICKTLRLLIKA